MLRFSIALGLLLSFSVPMRALSANSAVNWQRQQAITQQSQTEKKKTFERAEAFRSRSSISQEQRNISHKFELGLKKAQKWIKTQWKNIQRNLLKVNKTNSPPTGGDFHAFTEESGVNSVFEFQFDDELEDSDGELTYVEWDFDDGSVVKMPMDEVRDEGSVIFHVFPAAGTYNVTVKVYDDAGDFSFNSHEVIVTADRRPAPNFSAIPNTGNIVDFAVTANDPENSVAKYVWDFGDGSPVEEFTTTNLATHEFPTSGEYEVQVYVEDTAGLGTSIRKKIYVDTTPSTTDEPYPIVRIDKLYGTAPLTVNFDASLSVDSANSAITEFEWDFGDHESVMNVSTLSNPVHKFKAPGTYNIRVRIKDSNDNTSERFYAIYVAPANEASPRIVAYKWNSDRNVSFNSSALAVGVPLDQQRMFWNFGDGEQLENAYPNHTYTLDGTYTVKMAGYDVRGKRYTSLHHMTVRNQDDRPDPRSRMDNPYLPVEQAGEYSMNDSMDPQENLPMTYTWNFSDGSPMVSGVDMKEMEHEFIARGYYPVTVFVTNSRGISVDRRMTTMVQDGSETKAQIAYSPTIGIAPLEVDFNDSFSFSTDSTIVDYIWKFDSNGESYETSHSFSKTFDNPGEYSFRLYVIDALGNESVSEKFVVVLDSGSIPSENEVPNASLQSEYWGGDAGNFAFKGWDSWDPDGWVQFHEWTVDGITQPEGGELFTTLSPGPHTVAYTARDNWGSSTTISKTFKVGLTKDTELDMLITSATPDKLTPVEFDGSASMVNGVELSSLEWDFGDGNFARGEVVNHVYAAAGTYTVRLSVIDFEGNYQFITENLVVSEP